MNIQQDSCSPKSSTEHSQECFQIIFAEMKKSRIFLTGLSLAYIFGIFFIYFLCTCYVFFNTIFNGVKQHLKGSSGS